MLPCALKAFSSSAERDGSRAFKLPCMAQKLYPEIYILASALHFLNPGLASLSQLAQRSLGSLS